MLVSTDEFVKNIVCFFGDSTCNKIFEYRYLLAIFNLCALFLTIVFLQRKSSQKCFSFHGGA